MKVLILDTETSGLDETKDRVVEVAFAIWDTRFLTMVSAFSTLVPQLFNEAEAVNQIPAAALQSMDAETQKPTSFFGPLMAAAFEADAIMAHNAEFDRNFLAVAEGVTFDAPWVCSCHHMEWPIVSGSKSLASLCLAAGVGVSHAHRALTDVLLLVRLLERVGERVGVEGIEKLIRNGMRPRAKYRALVHYDDRGLAKDAGFMWNNDTKQWTKDLVTEDLEPVGPGATVFTSKTHKFSFHVAPV